MPASGGAELVAREDELALLHAGAIRMKSARHENALDATPRW
jgi:hypothetical protein